MTEKVTCAELGIENCDFEASGETAGDVIRQVVKHVRAEHHIDMPDADAILSGEVRKGHPEMAEPGAVVIVERLQEALDIEPSAEGERATPSIGRTPTA